MEGDRTDVLEGGRAASLHLASCAQRRLCQRHARWLLDDVCSCCDVFCAFVWCTLGLSFFEISNGLLNCLWGVSRLVQLRAIVLVFTCSHYSRYGPCPVAVRRKNAMGAQVDGFERVTLQHPGIVPQPAGADAQRMVWAPGWGPLMSDLMNYHQLVVLPSWIFPLSGDAGSPSSTLSHWVID